MEGCPQAESVSTAETDRAVLVTGGTGFIGRYLVANLLQDGLTVYVLTRDPGSYAAPHKRVKLIAGDLARLPDLPDEISSVYHCAGVINNEDLMEDVNVFGTRKIVEAAMKRGCRLIHLSSAGVVGMTRSDHIDEETECRPRSIYEKTKLEAEKIVLEGVAMGLKAQVLRPTIVFGSGRNPVKDSFLHLVSAVKSGRYRNIGSGIYNLIHASEVVFAMRALDNDIVPNAGVYFINTPIKFSEFSMIVKAATTGKTDRVASIPYPVAYCAAALFSMLSVVTGARMPLTLSRLKALTDTRTFSQERLLKSTSYRPLFGVDHYIRQVCKEYEDLGLLGQI